MNQFRTNELHEVQEQSDIPICPKEAIEIAPNEVESALEVQHENISTTNNPLDISRNENSNKIDALPLNQQIPIEDIGATPEDSQPQNEHIAAFDEDIIPEAQEDEEGCSKGIDELPKDIRKDSSEEIREENETSQQPVIGGKKCFNKLCNSKKIHKKIRSKVETQRYRFLCKSCYENYAANSFCEFCEQIYENEQNEEDDTKWVGCDKCDRWNHLECERKFRLKNFEIGDHQYFCLGCSKKNKNGHSNPENESESKKKIMEKFNPDSRVAKSRPEISKNERTPIFYKKVESFPYLESFLQSYNFKLWLSDTSVREDLDSLRNCMRYPVEEEPKKTKKVKLDI